MLAILSPAKNMREAQGPLPPTRPLFPEQTLRLLELLRRYTPWQLEELMKINPDLALRAFASFRDCEPGAPGSPSLLAYHGLLYQNLAARDFSRDDFAFAQEHLRVLSAFYGMLRPLDGIQPYRLEFLCKLKIDGAGLYAFWGDRLYRGLFSAGEPVVNLASGEYSKAVVPWLGAGDVFVTCDFLVPKRGKLTALPTAAKMARGRMARYIVKNRVDRPEGLQEFRWDGFAFAPRLSTSSRYVFIREPG